METAGEDDDAADCVNGMSAAEQEKALFPCKSTREVELETQVKSLLDKVDDLQEYVYSRLKQIPVF